MLSLLFVVGMLTVPLTGTMAADAKTIEEQLADQLHHMEGAVKATELYPYIYLLNPSTEGFFSPTGSVGSLQSATGARSPLGTRF